MSESFDPYHVWLGIPPESRPPTHYELLGISPNEREKAVIEAAVLRQSGYVRNFQLGKYAKDATKLLNEIAAAKTCLLDPAKRVKYDAELKSRQPTAIHTSSQAAQVPIALAPLPPAVDLDLLAAAAAPPALRPSLRRRPASLTLKLRKRKTSSIAWRLPVGIGISVGIVLAAIALWPKPPQQPQPAVVVASTPAPPGEPEAPILGAPAAQPQPKDEIAPPAPAPPPPLAIAPFSAEEARQHQERWAKYLGREVEETNTIGMKMVLIPPGEFDAGTTDEERERLLELCRQQNRPDIEADMIRNDDQIHRVSLSAGYFIGQSEVTVGQF